MRIDMSTEPYERQVTCTYTPEKIGNNANAIK